ncbi:phage tail assembly protein [Dakarella massiliensis]|uniref:phage tail assembly protein n=1 Tax=Dakarella massiliensis TaxID=1506471 RepID=UPI003A94AE69
MGAAEFKLTAPVKRGEDTIEVLELREPTAKDIKVLGFPITGEKRVDAAVVYDYIERLAAIPPSTVDQISASDFIGLMALVLGFFGGASE